MPARSKRTCSRPGCPNLTEGGLCAEHRKAAYRAQDEHRGTRQQRGYGARHEHWARCIRARDPVCVDPMGRHPGEVRPSVVADHIVPLKEGGGWEFSNGRGLCYACHEAVTRRGSVRGAA